MRNRKWIRAQQLDEWANRVDARFMLPDLVRRLIHATLERSDLQHISFPGGEETHRAGYDGVSKARNGNAWIPAGTTFWELSASSDIKGKLDADYATRIQNPQQYDLSTITYIAITLRDFNGKFAWEEGKRRDNIWGDVRVYDSDNLEQWLETAPGVALWLAPSVSNAPRTGAHDVSTHWENLQASLRSPLPASILLLNREAITKVFQAWVNGIPAPLELSGQSQPEIINVFCAWVSQLKDDDQAAIISRCVIIDTQDAFEELVDIQQRLILVCSERLSIDSQLVSWATLKGHHVLLPIPSARGVDSNEKRLGRLEIAGLERALIDAGLTEGESYSLARQCGGSFTILKRRFSSVPQITVPAWGTAENRSTLAPLLLASAWRDDHQGDMDCVADLAGKAYQDARQVVVRWNGESDSPVRWANGSWEFIAPHDAWTILCPAISPTNLNTFQQRATSILSEIDPRLELPPEDRWQAGIKGKKLTHSIELRSGITQMLAILGTRPDSEQPPANISLQAVVNSVVQRVLSVGTNWRIWASLGNLLPLLAEAAPNVFLEAVEASMRSEEPELVKLFSEEGPTFFGRAEHAGLLWALERVAWAPQYLSRAASLLALLNEHDPGGSSANRPINSLKSIFFPWKPHTVATLPERLATLKRLLEMFPSTGWELCIVLIPNCNNSILLAPAPEWRDWAEGRKAALGHDDLVAFVDQLAELLVEAAKTSAERWTDVLEKLPFFTKVGKELIINRLDSFDVSTVEDDLRVAVWQRLRILTMQTRRYDEDGTLELVGQLKTLCGKYKPQNPVQLAIPLFDRGYETWWDSTLSWEQQEETRLAQQRSAAATIFIEAGFKGIISLLSAAEDKFSVGYALAEHDAEELDSSVLPESLSSDPSLAEFASGYLRGRMTTKSVDWVKNIVSIDWTPLQIAILSVHLPFDESTWKFLSDSGEDTHIEYWRRVDSHHFHLSCSQLDIAASHLLNVGRPITAIQLIYMQQESWAEIGSDKLLQLLNRCLSTHPDEKNRLEPYYLQILIEHLQNDNRADKQLLAKLEWNLLPALPNSFMPKTLEAELATSPELYIELLSFLYKPRNEERKIVQSAATEHDKAKAHSAWGLLSGWELLPGTIKESRVDTAYLLDWVDSARKLAKVADRLEVCDLTIGGLFARSSADLEGNWPCEAVREALEASNSLEIEQGMVTGIFNKRGVVTKSLGEGGHQERQLVNKYRSYVALYQSRWPRTAAVMQKVADSYDNEARSADLEAEAEN